MELFVNHCLTRFNLHLDLTVTMFNLIERVESLEAKNSVLREEIDVLQNTVAQQEQIIADLQLVDNSTSDRLEVVETDLQGVEGDLQGMKLLSKSMANPRGILGIGQIIS